MANATICTVGALPAADYLVWFCLYVFGSYITSLEQQSLKLLIFQETFINTEIYQLFQTSSIPRRHLFHLKEERRAPVACQHFRRVIFLQLLQKFLFNSLSLSVFFFKSKKWQGFHYSGFTSLQNKRKLNIKLYLGCVWDLMWLGLAFRYFLFLYLTNDGNLIIFIGVS